MNNEHSTQTHNRPNLSGRPVCAPSDDHALPRTPEVSHAVGEIPQHRLLDQAKRTLDAIPQMVWTVAADGSDEFYNAQCIRFTGRQMGGFGELDRSDLIHDLDRARVVAIWKEKFISGEPFEAKYRLKTSAGDFRWILSQGEPVRDANGNPVRWYGTCTDVHDQVLERETRESHEAVALERIRWAAEHDPLTGLPNRTRFQHTLDQWLVEARSSNSSFTVLMMNFDDFKRTNGAFGHDVGDALLKELADRLRSVVRSTDFVARLGGDEFAVLLRDVAQKAEVIAAMESVEAAIEVPCQIAGRVVNVTAGMGASSFPYQGSDRAELIKYADIALYLAKNAGRGISEIFEPAMRTDVQRRLSMLGLARAAIDDDRIIANYQPKVDLRTGSLDGFEALLRWCHPGKGLQTPDTIAGAFHDQVLAAEISDRMIEMVLADMCRWADAGVPFGHVAINAAAAEFKSGAFADKLLGRLHRANLPASLVQLEVTETVFLGRGAERVEDALKALSNEGIGIALDDFGTGYASLSHLNKFPVSVLKIDRSFISTLETRPADAMIVRSIIKLGRSLGMRIVAEGIETQAQAEFLRKHRCHAGQGYLFGKAVAPSEISSLVTTWAEDSTRANTVRFSGAVPHPR